MRRVEAEAMAAGLSEAVLMERAALAAHAILAEMAPTGEAVFLCGPGNNGGDGLALARLRALAGGEVFVARAGLRCTSECTPQCQCMPAKSVCSNAATKNDDTAQKTGQKIGDMCGDFLAKDTLEGQMTLAFSSENKVFGRSSEGAAVQEGILRAMGVPVLRAKDENELLAALAARKPVVVVDALLGTGLSRAPEGQLAAAILWMNAQTAPVLALDIPSGVSSADGSASGPAVRAARTVAFGRRKPGHLLFPGRALCGETTEADIGLWPGCGEPDGPSALEAADAAALVPPRPMDAHKGVFGHALLVAGSQSCAGAAALCALGAVRSGAGLVTLASVPEAVSALRAVSPEAMARVLPSGDDGSLSPEAAPIAEEALARFQSVGVGPGLTTGQGARAALEAVWRSGLPIVADADALNIIASAQSAFAPRSFPTIITPHPGEMARLTGLSVREITSRPMEAARGLASRIGAIVLLKGATTVIASPSGKIALNVTGCPGMATGGSGDVLTGLIAGLLAQGMDAFSAARLGAYLHGRAGEAAQRRSSAAGMTAMDIAAALPEAWREIE